jgi:hypothetical protein
MCLIIQVRNVLESLLHFYTWQKLNERSKYYLGLSIICEQKFYLLLLFIWNKTHFNQVDQSWDMFIYLQNLSFCIQKSIVINLVAVLWPEVVYTKDCTCQFIGFWRKLFVINYDNKNWGFTRFSITRKHYWLTQYIFRQITPSFGDTID